MRDVAGADATVVDAARSALLETTEANTVGAVMGVEEPEDGVLEVLFENTLPGYPGWAWSVGVSILDGAEAPSVLEVGLLPAEGSLTAPEWVPWSDRLAEYRAAQIAKGEDVDAEPGEDDEDDLLDDEADEIDDVDDVDDVDEQDLLAGEDDDLDGVDFEEHEDEADEDLVDVEDEAPASAESDDDAGPDR